MPAAMIKLDGIITEFRQLNTSRPPRILRTIYIHSGYFDACILRKVGEIKTKNITAPWPKLRVMQIAICGIFP